MRREGLIRARGTHNWSQAEAAEAVGVSRLALSQWERGVATPHPANISRISEIYNMSAEELDLVETKLTRRNMLFAIPGSIIALEELMRSSEYLAQCAIGVPSLWDLYFSGKMEQVATILPLYRSCLTALVQQPGALQNQAFALASQVYQLQAEVMIDQEDHQGALIAGQQALLFAQNAGDANIQVASLIKIANFYFHRKMATKALQAYQQALPVLGNASPLLQGRIYVGLAEVHGMRGEKQEAMRAIGMAHDIFPDRPQLDPSYYYTQVDHYALHVFGEGQTRLYLGQPKEALKALEYIGKQMGPQIDSLHPLDFLFYQGEAAAMLGDLDQAVQRVEDGAQLARRVNSRLYWNKIAATYHNMVQKWHSDARVRALEPLFQPW